MKVRAWDDMEKEFGLDEGGDIKCRCWFTKQMRPTCGKTMRIESVFEESKIYRLAGDITHHFTDEMLEAVADDFKVGDRVRVIGNTRHSAESAQRVLSVANSRTVSMTTVFASTKPIRAFIIAVTSVRNVTGSTLWLTRLRK